MVFYSWNTMGYLQEKGDICNTVTGTKQIQVFLKEDCLYMKK